MNTKSICFTARVLRKQDNLPRYIVVKPEYVGGRTRAFSADVMLNDAGPFKRTEPALGQGL